MANTAITQEDTSPWNQAGSFPRGAYIFVQQGLAYAAQKTHGELTDCPPGERHVGGAQLCQGLREYAIARYGALAIDVLHHWNIRSTADFGRIVYQMIEKGHMTQGPEDRFEHFVNVYRFDEAFAPDQVYDKVLVRN